MSKTIAVHVRYKSLHISLPCSAKQQREMTKYCSLRNVNDDDDDLLFVFLFGIERCHCTLAVRTFIMVITQTSLWTNITIKTSIHFQLNAQILIWSPANQPKLLKVDEHNWARRDFRRVLNLKICRTVRNEERSMINDRKVDHVSIGQECSRCVASQGQKLIC